MHADSGPASNFVCLVYLLSNVFPLSLKQLSLLKFLQAGASGSSAPPPAQGVAVAAPQRTAVSAAQLKEFLIHATDKEFGALAAALSGDGGVDIATLRNLRIRLRRERAATRENFFPWLGSYLAKPLRIFVLAILSPGGFALLGAFFYLWSIYYPSLPPGVAVVFAALGVIISRWGTNSVGDTFEVFKAKSPTVNPPGPH